MAMTFTLKTLEKHSAVVTRLLDTIDCDYAYTGAVREAPGTNTHSWYISHPLNEDSIGIEDSLEDLHIPYDRSHRGPDFRLFSHRVFRIDHNHEHRCLDTDHGDNTLELLNELEDAIAGNDYSFVRNFIRQKRNSHLVALTWDTQKNLTGAYEVA